VAGAEEIGNITHAFIQKRVGGCPGGMGAVRDSAMIPCEGSRQIGREDFTLKKRIKPKNGDFATKKYLAAKRPIE
jgi:hypothetical protein